MADSKSKTEIQPSDPAGLDANAKSTLNGNRGLAKNLDRILVMFESNESSFSQVACEVRKLDELSDQLLKRINSAEFSLEHSVKDVQHAVAMLGQNRTIEVVKEEITRIQKRSKRTRTKRPAKSLKNTTTEQPTE